MGHEGRFIWYELMTGDRQAAEAFYTAVVGWNARDAGGENEGYTILSAGERGVGGMMTMPQEARAAGAEPGWIGYIAVDDADAAAARIEAAGGRVHRAPADIPDVGRFAVVADPQGAVFQLLAPQGEGEMKPLDRMAPGNVGWHELYTTDWEAGFAFYSEQFEWVRDRAMDMGPMGTYQLFAPAEGSEAVGGIMNVADQQRPTWSFYFVVAGIDAAAERVKAAGGEVAMGPMEVPDGSFVIQGRDPEGAAFALVSATR
ncbi:MAG: VOC family protein [Alphaproteobacteria bacterium]|nr:VOC family protein [Alphaproteobacteria bacterium]MBV9371809.1 VOC family protein [Alphaproteobacteria bacterium]MBV9901906.1 VOC family protein [Alphaproteobacteria bacterium]